MAGRCFGKGFHCRFAQLVGAFYRVVQGNRAQALQPGMQVTRCGFSHIIINSFCFGIIFGFGGQQVELALAEFLRELLDQGIGLRDRGMSRTEHDQYRVGGGCGGQGAVRTVRRQIN